MSFFTATELVYARRSPALGNLIGGFPEHWDIRDARDAIVATVEENMSMLDRAARFMSSRFAAQQRHRLEVVDPAGRPLLVIVKPQATMRHEHADVLAVDGTAAGTVRLIRPSGSDFPGLGFYDPSGTRLGEARENRAKTAASGHRTHEVFTADETPVGGFASTKTRGGAGPTGYRFQVADEPAEPLRSLVRAAPIVSYFLH